MTDVGPQAGRPDEDEDLSLLPDRTCIVTRRKGSPADLVRFAADSEGRVVPDIKARLPGRGVWVNLARGDVALAVKRRLFARGFKRPVVVPDDLPADVSRLLRRDALQFLSLANKAGALVTGFGKVEAAIGKGSVVALVHASDAADDGIRKIGQALKRARGEGADGVAIIRDLTGEELSLALGGSLVIHAALVAGPGSDGFLSAWQRLALYEGETGLPGSVSTGGMGHGTQQDRTAE